MAVDENKDGVETRNRIDYAAVRASLPQDRSLCVGDIETRYWAEGSRGAPVILIHGLGGYLEAWALNISALAQQNRVYAMDLPGHGRSAKPVAMAYDLPTFVRFIHDFMAMLSLERASLVGHSLGGAIALRFTLTYPHMVDRLVLVDSAGLGHKAGFALRLGSLPILGERLTRPSLEGARATLAGGVYDPTLIADEVVQHDYQMKAQRGAQQAFLKTLRGITGFFGQKESLYGPHLEQLSAITQPTLVLWGREDPVVPVAHAETSRRIPNVRVQIVEHCGHLLQVEHPAVFNQVVQEFLHEPSA